MRCGYHQLAANGGTVQQVQDQEAGQVQLRYQAEAQNLY